MTDRRRVLEDKVLPSFLTSQVSKKIQTGVIKGGTIPQSGVLISDCAFLVSGRDFDWR